MDRDGVRIAAGAKSAYDLFLSRSLARAKIVRAPTALEAVELFKNDKLEAVAGVRQALVTSSESIPGSRVLPDRFMVIAQAAGVPTGRDAGAQLICASSSRTSRRRASCRKRSSAAAWRRAQQSLRLPD